MRCLSCGFDNPEGVKFCIECAAPLNLKPRCPQCGFENLLQAKFCGECATPLTGSVAAPSGRPPPAGGGRKTGASLTPTKRTPKATNRGRAASRELSAQRNSLETARAASEGERRQLTVMFCDLVGSTALSEQLDPEEWRAIVRAYQAASATIIRRFEGHIAQYLGDGLLVYFGYPTAHEDDAQRAARAGLGILTELHALNARGSSSIQVRIGIHTGLVVVGEIGDSGKREQLALVPIRITPEGNVCGQKSPRQPLRVCRALLRLCSG